MDFSTDKFYVIVEKFFDQPAKYVLAECFKGETDNVLSEIDLKQFEGEGVVVSLCRILGPVEPDERKEDALILTGREVDYAFRVEETLACYPRIEGDFSPGVYFSRDEGKYFKVSTLEDVTAFFSIALESGYGIHEFMVVCKIESLNLVLVKNGAGENLETQLTGG